jgi:hypothetical protein
MTNEMEQARVDAQRRMALETMGLTVLLARAGGSLTISRAEYEAVVARYGGRAKLAIHLEVLAPPGGGPDEVRLTLVRKDPAPGELPS